MKNTKSTNIYKTMGTNGAKSSNNFDKTCSWQQQKYWQMVRNSSHKIKN
jgi:hypothetical protein